MSNVEAKVLHGASDLRALLPEWRELFAACVDATPFQNPSWISGWIEAFAPSRLITVEVRHQRRLVGIAPLLVYPKGSEQVLAFAGGGVSDYLGWLVDGDRGPWSDEVLFAFLRAVQDVPHWTVLDLTDLRCEDRVLRSALGQGAQPHDVCFVLELPSNREELLNSFSKKQRANIRYARSRLERAGGGTFELANPGTLSRALEELFTLHGSRWQTAGQPGVLHDPAVQQFHRLVAPALLPEGLLRLYQLRVGQRTIAATYSLFFRDTAYCYIQGFDPEFAELSPGTLLMFHVIEDAVHHGLSRFDFLRGEEAYKLHWRPRAENTYRIELTRAKLLHVISRSAEFQAA
jgi:CelD/BcsL family acetyltransferase involved in cellulose biosynthesis